MGIVKDAWNAFAGQSDYRAHTGAEPFYADDQTRQMALSMGINPDDPRNAEQLRGMQMQRDRAGVANVGQQWQGAVSNLQQAAAGQGPSAAQDTLREGSQRAISSGYGQAASANVNPGQRAALMNTAIGNTAAAGQQMSRDAATLRAGEVATARGQLNQALGGYGANQQGLYMGSQQTEGANLQAKSADVQTNAGTAAGNAKNKSGAIGNVLQGAGAALAMFSDVRGKTDIVPLTGPIADMARTPEEMPQPTTVDAYSAKHGISVPNVTLDEEPTVKPTSLFFTNDAGGGTFRDPEEQLAYTRELRRIAALDEERNRGGAIAARGWQPGLLATAAGSRGTQQPPEDPKALGRGLGGIFTALGGGGKASAQPKKQGAPAGIGNVFSSLAGAQQDLQGQQAQMASEPNPLATAAGSRKALAPVHPYEYRYKPETAARIGEDTAPRTGIMAQELEQSPMLRSAVIDTPEGKAIDGHRALSASLAMNAGMDKRLKRLEAALGRGGGG